MDDINRELSNLAKYWKSNAYVIETDRGYLLYEYDREFHSSYDTELDLRQFLVDETVERFKEFLEASKNVPFQLNYKYGEEIISFTWDDLKELKRLANGKR